MRCLSIGRWVGWKSVAIDLMETPSSSTAPRAAISLLYLFGAVVLGALAAPPCYNAILAMARSGLLPAGLLEVEFERVLSRCVLVIVILGLYPAFKFSGIRSLEAVGYPAGAGRNRLLLPGLLVGLVSMGLLYLAGLFSGVLIFAPKDGGLAGRLGLICAGAVIVAFVEETLFRGILFSAVRRRMSFFTAAFSVGVFFALLHFAKPEPTVAVAHGHWYSGFSIIPDMFNLSGDLHHYVPFFFTLVLLALTLSSLYESTGSLAGPVGLHAGWIIAMRSGTYFFERNPEAASGLFGPSAYLHLSWAAFWLILLFFAAAERKRLRAC